MDKVNFSLTYSALKMFGKQLYSNIGSALSELVANGLDAKADNIYILIDARDKENSYVEIFDDGKGMSRIDIRERYIVIGYNKRKKEADMSDGKAMGRKGIGKLAALFLSNKFTVISKTKNEPITSWTLDVTNLEESETPSLNAVDVSSDKLHFFEKLNEKGKGTIISLENVNLVGLGDRAFESIEEKLSNFFLYNVLDQKVFIKIITNEDDTKLEFKSIEKHIAYKNFAYVYTTNTDMVNECINNKFSLPYKTKNGQEKKFTINTEVENLSKSSIIIEGEKEFFGKKKKYCLNGWVGIHSSIDGDIALANDDRYIKNKYYTPNQLRVYVRNKLALANMIEHLGITRAFANYIEGEISFNVLDDDDLPDIATAGRQDFDTQDPRFILLKEIMTKIGNALVAKRQVLADKLNKKKKEEDMKISSKSKSVFKGDMQAKLNGIKGISRQDKDDIENFVLSQMEGDINLVAKAEYTVFISHASKDSIFSDFIYHYLKKCGFKGDMTKDDCEIFYSSSGLDTDKLEPLSTQIKEYITRKNNDILFIPSKNFNASQFCLFEGGAAWATRSVGEYKILAIDYDQIPTFLTNGKGEISLGIKEQSDLVLDEIKYNNVVRVINRLIEHLNKNRVVNIKTPVNALSIVEFPDKVQLKSLNKKIEDFMDKDLLEYWTTYVLDQADNYFEVEN